MLISSLGLQRYAALHRTGASERLRVSRACEKSTSIRDLRGSTAVISPMKPAKLVDRSSNIDRANSIFVRTAILRSFRFALDVSALDAESSR